MKRCERIVGRSVFPEPDFRLRVMRVPDHGASQEQHTHSFEELVVILAGHGKHRVGEEIYDIAAGDIFVLLGEMTHCYPESRGLSLINILYDTGNLRLRRADIGALPGFHALFEIEPRLRQQQHFKNRLRLSVNELGRLTRLVADMEEEIVQQGPGYRFMAIAHFMRLIGFLARAYSGLPADEPRPVTQISEVLGYLERNYSQPIVVEDLTRVAHMSQSTLFRTFQQILGRSPIDHLLHLRIDKATQLLARTRLRVGEVSAAVGFNDSNYFTRQFRQITGLSPRDYRRQSNA